MIQQAEARLGPSVVVTYPARTRGALHGRDIQSSSDRHFLIAALSHLAFKSSA